MINFDLGSLTADELMRALENNGYNLTGDDQYLNAGIQEIIAVHPKDGFGSQQEWVYEVIFNEDGSFAEDDNRQGNLFVSFDPHSMRVIAEW